MMRSTTRYSITLMTFEFAEGRILLARNQVNERLGECRISCRRCRRRAGADRDATRGDADVPIEGGVARSASSNATFDRDYSAGAAGLPGVADRQCAGCFVRTFEVVPNPGAMAARGITIGALTTALEGNNANDGARSGR